MSRIIYIWISTICLLLSAPALSQDYQLEYKLSKEDMLIGDHQELTIRVSPVSQDDKLELMPDVTDSGIEMLEKKRVERRKIDDGYALSQTLVFTAYDTGRVVFPPMMITLESAISTDTFYTDSIPLTVGGVTLDGELGNIKDIYRPSPPWLRYALMFAALLLVIGLIWWFFKNRTKKEIEPIKITYVAPPPNPWDRARESLDRLKQENLVSRGQAKEYQARLTYIMREFLGEYYDYPALEMTTRENIKMLARTEFPEDMVGKMSDVLSISDLVKYAKAKPEEEFHEEMMAYAYEVLHRLPRKPMPHELNEEEDSI